MEQGTTEESSTPPKTDARLYVAFSGLLVMTLMVALDSTTIAPAIGTIAQHLNGSAAEALWANRSFLLCSTVFQPSYASFSYIFNRKVLISVSLAFFLVGAILCGTTHAFSLLLLGRSLQGCGGAGLLVLTEVVLTDLIPLIHRGLFTGILGSVYALGVVSGPIIGGAFARVNWRWIFWIQVPLIGLATILIIPFLPLNEVSSSWSSKVKRADWLGSVLFIGSTTSILIPVTWGGVQYPWLSWRTLLPIFCGFAGLAAFVICERIWSAEPIIPASIFPNMSVNLGYLTSSFQGLLLYCVLYCLPLYLAVSKGHSPILAGVVMLPLTFGNAVSTVLAGILISTTNSYRWTLWTGWILTTLGFGLLLLLGTLTSVQEWVFLVLVSAMGLGILSPGLQFQVQDSQTNQKTVGLAVSMYSFLRTLGQTLAVELAGDILQYRTIHYLQSTPQYGSQASELCRDLLRLVQTIQPMPPGTSKATLQKAYVNSLDEVWLFCTILAGIALLSSFFGPGHVRLSCCNMPLSILPFG